MRHSCSMTRLRTVRKTVNQGIYVEYECSNCGNTHVSNTQPRECEVCDCMVTKIVGSVNK